MKNHSEILAFLPDSDQSTKPPSRIEQRQRRKQERQPRRYQPVVIVETEIEVLGFDAELLLAMLLLGRAGR